MLINKLVLTVSKWYSQTVRVLNNESHNETHVERQSSHITVIWNSEQIDDNRLCFGTFRFL